MQNIESIQTKNIIVDSSTLNLETNNSRAEIWSCAFSYDYKYFAWSTTDGFIKLIDTVDLRIPNNNVKISHIDCTEAVWSLAFGTSNTKLQTLCHVPVGNCSSKITKRFQLEKKLIIAAGLESGRIRLYDAHTRQFLFLLCDHKELVRHLKFTKDGSFQLASASHDRTVKLWDMFNDGNMYKTLTAHTGLVYACDWSPNMSLLCTVGANRQAFIWDTKDYTLKFTLKGHYNDVVTCEFSPDGVIIATGSFDTKICLWDVFTGALIRQFHHMLPSPSPIFAGGHNGAYVRGICFSDNSNRLISICDDKKLRIWSLSTRTQYPIAEAKHDKGVCCAILNNRTIMVGTQDGFMYQYESSAKVDSLVYQCRKIINLFIKREYLDRVKLPKELELLLKYNELKPQLRQNKTTANTKFLNSINVNCCV